MSDVFPAPTPKSNFQFAEPFTAQELCTRIKARLDDGRELGHFIVNDRVLAEVLSEVPQGLTDPFPKCIIEWSRYAEDKADREVAWPHIRMRFVVNVNVWVYAADYKQENRIYDCREMLTKIERWLTLQSTLSGYCETFDVTSVSSRSELLMSRGIIADGLIETTARVTEDRELED